jgi:hypothetical protein
VFVGLEHGAVVAEFPDIVEPAYYQQSELSEVHLFQIEVLDHERREVMAGYVEQQLVGAYLARRIQEYKQLGYVGIEIELERCVGIESLSGCGVVCQPCVPDHAAHVGRSTLEFASACHLAQI